MRGERRKDNHVVIEMDDQSPAYDRFPRRTHRRRAAPYFPRHSSTETRLVNSSFCPMSSDDSFSDRVSSFISGNRRGIVIGAAAAAVAIGGVAYYVASSRAGSGAGDEESLREGRKKDKKKKKHRKSAKDKDGPILEEKKPKATEVSDDGMHLHTIPLPLFLDCPSLT